MRMKEAFSKIGSYFLGHIWNICLLLYWHFDRLSILLSIFQAYHLSIRSKCTSKPNKKTWWHGDTPNNNNKSNIMIHGRTSFSCCTFDWLSPTPSPSSQRNSQDGKWCILQENVQHFIYNWNSISYKNPVSRFPMCTTPWKGKIIMQKGSKKLCNLRLVAVGNFTWFVDRK